MSDNDMVTKQTEQAIVRVRQQFRRQCHKMLDEYLSDTDGETSLPTIDMIIAYAGQGWGVSVGISLQEPAEETDIEAQAEASGIEVVRA